MVNRSGDAAVIEKPEVELLICCARSRSSSDEAKRIGELLYQGLDWNYLLRLALEHGTVPLLYLHLKEARPEALPESILGRLEGLFRENTRRNLLLTAALLELLIEFERDDIPVVPYKGPTLAVLAYGNLSLRQFNDLDLLVHMRDVARAEELLRRLGYMNLDPVDETRKDDLFSSEREHSFTRADDQTTVEIQWRIVSQHFSTFVPIDAGYLWGHLEPVTLGNKIVMAPSPDDLLLILCIHGSRHAWQRLAWICDVAELVRTHKELDWQRITARAEHLGSRRMLYLGLLLASDLLKAELPAEVTRRLREDPVLRDLAKQVYEWLFREGDDPDQGVAGSAFSAYHMRIRERARDKVRYFARRAVTLSYRDREDRRLPSYLSFLYYVMRSIRLIRTYGRRLGERFL